MDADDWLQVNAIKNMINVFKDNKNIGAVYGNYYYTNEQGKIIDTKKFKYYKKTYCSTWSLYTYKVNDLKKVKGYFTMLKLKMDGMHG